jgi:hypothetical protein
MQRNAVWRAVRVRRRRDPLGRDLVQRQAPTMSALHWLRQQRCNDPASGMGAAARSAFSRFRLFDVVSLRLGLMHAKLPAS